MGAARRSTARSRPPPEALADRTADQRTPRSKSTRRLIVAVQAKRSPGIGGRIAQGSGERQRRGTKGRHCPEPVRPKALDNRPAGKRKQSGRNTDADGTVDSQCRRLEEAKFAADSPLKGTGFEPQVPPNRRRSRGVLRSSVADRVNSWDGPRFRIRPPPRSRQAGRPRCLRCGGRSREVVYRSGDHVVR